MLRRRTFLKSALGATAALAAGARPNQAAEKPGDERSVRLVESLAGEDVFSYLQRTAGGFDATRYKQILGVANPFKEGDQTVGVAAADEASRLTARALLAATPLGQVAAHP